MKIKFFLTASIFFTFGYYFSFFSNKSINNSAIPQTISNDNCILNHLCLNLPNRDVAIIDYHTYLDVTRGDSKIQATTNGVLSKNGNVYILSVRKRHPELIIDILDSQGKKYKTIFPYSKNR